MSQIYGPDILTFDAGGVSLAAVFSSPSSKVFKEDEEIMPVPLSDSLSYMPWGGDNMMPHDILDMVDDDETVRTCMDFCAEVLFAGGLRYAPAAKDAKLPKEARAFLLDNNLDEYWYGVCLDFRQFGFAVSVLDLSIDLSRIVRLSRREACYCRFEAAGKDGHIPSVIYANWRMSVSPQNFERIPLLDPCAPYSDLLRRLERGETSPRYAVVSRVPTADSCYYPIPSYASIFKGRWYDIKKSIGEAKAARLRNSTVIKYQIEISPKLWEKKWKERGLASPKARQAFAVKFKQEIADYLSGAENAGKAIFSETYIGTDGKEYPEIKINKIDDSKEGGDWSVDIQEAVNMICFAMRVHSNLVGSVPGKSQSNNSGSDKRELYTIAQCQCEPLRRILMQVHRMICSFNGWDSVSPVCDILQLTTLDQHRDLKNSPAQ